MAESPQREKLEELLCRLCVGAFAVPIPEVARRIDALYRPAPDPETVERLKKIRRSWPNFQRRDGHWLLTTQSEYEKLLNKDGRVWREDIHLWDRDTQTVWEQRERIAELERQLAAERKRVIEEWAKVARQFIIEKWLSIQSGDEAYKEILRLAEKS